MRRFEVLDDGEAVAVRGEQLVVERLERALCTRGRADLVLAGGSTPRRLYERLAALPVGTLDWNAVRLWFGDERTVPPEHADSNYGMVKRALIDRLSDAGGGPRVHRIAGEISPEQAASDYEQILEDDGRPPPRFDVVLLGMGSDGHTASLFPGTQLLDERAHLVGAAWVEHLGTIRISLTVTALADAGLVVFLVVGADKAERVADILVGEKDFPAGKIGPGPGEPETVWLLDRAAASMLS